MQSANQAGRSSGYALAILLFSLSVSTAAIAQAPARNYGFCYGLSGNPRVNNFTRIFVLGPSSPPGALSGFLRYLHEKYAGYTTPETRCAMFATAAEAKTEYQKELDLAAPHAAKWPIVEIDWIPEGGYPLGGAPPPAAAVAAPATAKPTSPAPPNPAPATAAARPAAPAPAKPAPAAAGKPGVYVICRAEWNNRDVRRFYNPPVDGRGAGYTEWQASWREYLVKQHGFKGSNAGCGKYPNREAAQTDYDSWVANARATPTVNGQNSPIIITNWKY